MKPIVFPTRRHGPVLRTVIAVHGFTESHPLTAWLIAVAFAGVCMYVGGQP